MRLFTPTLVAALLLLAGCKSTAPQRVSVGLRVHVPDPTARNRHRAAKIPVDLMVEYEVGGNQPPQPASDDE